MLLDGTYDLEHLAARQEILDRIHLYAHAIDRRAWPLLEHVFHDDAVWHLSGGGGSWRDFTAKSIKAFARSLKVTHHQVGNTLVRFASSEAFCETYVTAYCRIRADAPLGGMFGGTGCEYDVIGGARYCDRFEHRDGEWKIASRRGATEWRHLQAASDGILDTIPAELRGHHDDSDAATPVTRLLRDAMQKNQDGREGMK